MMNRRLILWTITCFMPIWLMGQNCELETDISLFRNTTTTHTISVGNYLLDDLSDPAQGVCAVNIFFLHHWIKDVEIDLISPAGQRVNLIGPDTDATQGSVGSLFNISFVRCDSTPSPQVPFGNRFENTVNIFPGSYKGSYHPFNGCLEDFNTGSIIGDWTLEVRDFSNNQIDGSEIFDFSIVFCDDSGNPCCFADAGILVTSDTTRVCEGDPVLNTTLPGSITVGAGYPIGNVRPNSDEYAYTYLISESNNVIARQDVVDLTGFSAGNYQICGLSYLLEDALNLPSTDG